MLVIDFWFADHCDAISFQRHSVPLLQASFIEPPSTVLVPYYLLYYIVIIARERDLQKMAPSLVLRPANEGGARPTSVTTTATNTLLSSSSSPSFEVNGLTHRYGTLRLRGAASPTETETETETVHGACARARPRRKARGDERAGRLKKENENEGEEEGEEEKAVEGMEIPSSSSNRRRIRWADDVVNNEGMGKKSSKGEPTVHLSLSLSFSLCVCACERTYSIYMLRWRCFSSLTWVLCF